MPRVASLALVASLACHPVAAQPRSTEGEGAVASQGTAAGGPPVPGHAPADPASLRSLVGDLGHNFRDLPSLETLAILGVGGGLAGLAHGEDREITRRWAASSPLDRFFEPGEVAGSGWVQAGGAVGAYILGRASGHHRTALLGADLVRSQAVNGVLTQGLKLSVRRRRPDGTPLSFPSGHASGSFATATVLQRHFGWKAGVPAYAAAAFIAGSRLQENRHYPSDVLFGAALGIVSGRTVTIGRGRAAFAVVPLASQRGTGISLVHRPRR